MLIINSKSIVIRNWNISCENVYVNVIYGDHTLTFYRLSYNHSTVKQFQIKSISGIKNYFYALALYENNSVHS